MAPSH